MVSRPSVVSTARSRPRVAGRLTVTLDVAPSGRRQAREWVRRNQFPWNEPAAGDLAVVADQLVALASARSERVRLSLQQAGRSLLVAVHELGDGLDPSGERRGPSSGLRVVLDEELHIVRSRADQVGCHRHAEGGMVTWASLTLDELPVDAAAVRAGIVETDAAPAVGCPPLRVADSADPATRWVHSRVQVNGWRPSGMSDRGWQLELLLTWWRNDPSCVDVALRSSPRHPALPRGQWRIDLETLHRGLSEAVVDGAVRLHPDPTALWSLFEFTDGPRELPVLVPTKPLRAFLTETRAALPGSDTPGGSPVRHRVVGSASDGGGQVGYTEDLGGVPPRSSRPRSSKPRSSRPVPATSAPADHSG